MTNEVVNKNEFVALRYSGSANGVLFDSNEEENIKKLHQDANAREVIVVVGKGMVVPGLDKALEGKEIGVRYEVSFDSRDRFGERKRELVKTIPLKVFTEKQINPYPGLTLAIDNMTARVITVSGARVITDFNNPLASKSLHYSFMITRKVTDEQERVRALFEVSFKFAPEFEIKDKITIKGPQILEMYVKAFSDMFKELVGKELAFELKVLPAGDAKKNEFMHDDHSAEHDHVHEHDSAHDHNHAH